jgi:hypothetical protein
VNFLSVGKSLAASLAAAAAAFVLGACGGGGAGTSTGPNQGGSPSISPKTGTFYAGVPNSFVITGGRRPYKLTSTEPSVLPVPSTLDANSFQVVPANPGVVNTGIPVGGLPVRTVTVTVIDALQQTDIATIEVAQNFLTGYGVTFNSNCPTSATSGAAAQACSGGETVVTLASVTNGNLFGNRAVRFEVVRGPFQFVNPANNSTANTFTTTTDHAGLATAILRINPNVTAQFAVLRVVDVATGVYTDHVFAINGASGIAVSTLTAIPNVFTFTGVLTTQCGTGSADFTVFDGQPPYTATVSDPNIRVSPSQAFTNPATFTVTAFNNSVCLANATVIITDALGARTTVTVNTEPGSTAPPAPQPLAVQPTAITLACGTSGSVSVVGGAGSVFVNSTHPRITAVASGNTITITRLGADPAGTFPTTGTISVSDGRTIIPISVTITGADPVTGRCP